MSSPAAPDAQVSSHADPDRILLEAVKQRQTGLCLQLLQQRVHRRGLTGLERLVNQLRNEVSDPGAAAWFLCLLELEAIPLGGVGAAPQQQLGSAQAPHQNARADSGALGRTGSERQVPPAQAMAGEPHTAAQDQASSTPAARPGAGDPTEATAPEPATAPPRASVLVAAEPSPSAQGGVARQGSEKPDSRPQRSGEDSTASAADPSPATIDAASRSPMSCQLEQKAGAAVDAAFAALAAMFSEGTRDEAESMSAAASPATGTSGSLPRAAADSRSGSTAGTVPLAAPPAPAAAPAPAPAPAPATAAPSPPATSGPGPAVAVSGSAALSAAAMGAGSGAAIGASTVAAAGPAPTATEAVAAPATGSDSSPGRRQPPVVIPQVGWSSWPSPSQRPPAAGAGPATTTAAAKGSVAMGPDRDPAAAPTDARPSRSDPDADGQPARATVEYGPPAASASPGQGALASAGAPVACDVEPQPGEAATPAPPAAHQLAMSQLLIQGKATISSALTSSRSKLAELRHRGGHFARARLRGLRDLMRDCLEESLSPLRSTPQPTGAAPFPQLQDPPVCGDRSDAGSPAGFAPGPVAAVVASESMPAPLRSPSSASARVDPLAGSSSQAALVSPRSDAQPPQPSSPSPRRFREPASRRSEAEASRPAPTPAALSDLQAWLPNCPDLPRAS